MTVHFHVYLKEVVLQMRSVDKKGWSIYTKSMNNTIRIAVLTVIALASPLAMADSGTKGSSSSDDCSVEQAFIAIPDLLVVRPISLAGCAVGFTAFVVSSPFTAMAECVDESWDTLVKTPARFTFERDLGDFDDVK